MERATFEEAIPVVTAHLSRDAHVHLALPGAGRLQIDRPLPFLFVYRRPADRQDPGTAELVTAEAAFFVAPGDDAHTEGVLRLSQAIGDALYNRFGAFLFVEVWSRPDAEAPPGEHVHPPAFRVVASSRDGLDRTAGALGGALERVSLDRQSAAVEVVRGEAAPPGLRAIYRSADDERRTCRVLGLEVHPVFRQTAAGPTFPLVLDALRRQVAQALRQGVHEWMTHRRSVSTADHYQALGPRALAASIQRADRRMRRIAGSFDFVLLATPTNGDAAWREFQSAGGDREPQLLYRPVPLHPDRVKRQLYDIRLEEVRDPTLQHLLRETRDSLDLMISMLTVRGSRDFLYGSLRLYGGVDDELLALARQVLERTRAEADAPAGTVGATEFRRRARTAVRAYREESERFAAKVRRRNDIASGVMVSKGDLLVSDSLAVTPARVDALIQHEVGTHLVTYYNGAHQPIGQLQHGLPGYEPLQEGLAVLAEHLAGGLTRRRLRVLAARVVAARSVADGAGFLDTYRTLHRDWDLGAHRAFTTAMRVHRGGGLTKDAAYLRGLADLLAYLSNDGELSPLFVGKIGLRHVPFVQELSRRRILRPPRHWPHYLRGPAARRRLEACRGRSVLDLCAEAP